MASLLTTVHGAFSAHVIAARLQSEGIDVELRGAMGSAYGLTMGDLARVDLYVPEEQLEDARLVMLASEIDDAMSLPDPAEDAPSSTASWVWIAALVLLVVAIAAPLLRYLAD